MLSRDKVLKERCRISPEGQDLHVEEKGGTKDGSDEDGVTSEDGVVNSSSESL